MARSEAQKAADKKYAAKINGKYKSFIVNVKPEEFEYFDRVIKNAGVTKADFLRKAVKALEEGKLS